MIPHRVQQLIIGGGSAGAAAAQRLVELGADSVLLVGDEAHPPYSRPKLSKQYLRGEVSADQVVGMTTEKWEGSGVQVCWSTAVVGLECETRRAHLANGQIVIYENALLATGARSLDVLDTVAEADTGRVFTLRTLGDADAIRRQASPGSRAVVIGGSFNACEVAASLAALGVVVDVLGLEEAPLQAALGQMAGRFVDLEMRRHGLRYHGGARVIGVDGPRSGPVTVYTNRGDTFACDFVVQCVGIRPNVDLARRSGLRLAGGGVACDSHMRTSAPAVFAAGDIATYRSPSLCRPVRFERFEAAWSQARVAAMNMTGDATVVDDRTPYFHSEFADWLSISGVPASAPWDREIVSGDPATGRFTVWQLASDVLVGMAAFGTGAFSVPSQGSSAQADIERAHAVLRGNESACVIGRD